MSRLIPTYIEQALRIEQLERELAEAQAEIVKLKDGFDHLLRGHLEELDAAIDEAMKEGK